MTDPNQPLPLTPKRKTPLRKPMPKAQDTLPLPVRMVPVLRPKPHTWAQVATDTMPVEVASIADLEHWLGAEVSAYIHRLERDYR